MKVGRRAAPVAVLVALAALAGLLGLDAFGPHTDDGCAVEIHCLACRTAVVRGAPAVVALEASFTLAELSPVAPAAASVPSEPALEGHATRGPPLSF